MTRMKKVLLMATLCLSVIACSNGKKKSETNSQTNPKDVVEVLYFHASQRCATCIAIEKNSRELLEAYFSEQLKSGKLVFKSIDLTEEEALADKYEVTWSSLVVIDYDKEGNEKAENMTEFAFGNVRNAPDKFKAELAEQITDMLNN